MSNTVDRKLTRELRRSDWTRTRKARERTRERNAARELKLLQQRLD